MSVIVRDILVLLTLTAWLLASTALAQAQKNLRQEMPPLYSIHRTKVELNSGDILIVLHKNNFTHPKRLYRFSSIEDLLDSGIFAGEGRGRLLCKGRPENPWCRNGTKPDPSFNCHAYSVGDIIGLTPTDWLDGASSELTNGMNPVQVALDNYFSLILELDKNPESVSGVAEASWLREDDVLALVKHDPDGSVEYVHSGRIVKEHGENWLASKLGEGPLIVAPLIAYTIEYEGLFDTIKVFRKKGDVQKIVGQSKMLGPRLIVLWVYYDRPQLSAGARTPQISGWASLAVFDDMETCKRSRKNFETIDELVGNGDKQAVCLPAGVELSVLTYRE